MQTDKIGAFNAVQLYVSPSSNEGECKAYQAFYGLKCYNLQKTNKETKKTNKLPYVAIKRQNALNNSEMMA